MNTLLKYNFELAVGVYISALWFSCNGVAQWRSAASRPIRIVFMLAAADAVCCCCFMEMKNPLSGGMLAYKE